MDQHARTRIVIDATPRGPHGPLAALRLRGESVLERLVKQTAGLSDEPVAICTAGMDGAPTGDVVVLRTDRLYDSSRVRRALRAGRDPETAVIWRLDTPEGLAGAAAELERRQSYQPLGRYWALGPARALARALAPTRVRPNAVTLAAAGLMLGAAAAVAFGGSAIVARAAVATALALALVLDTADGHLARLQGTASEFGRWLDAYLDELADMALHAAIAWGAFVRDGAYGWLLLGMVYAMGKYQFVVATQQGGAGLGPINLSPRGRSPAQRAGEGKSATCASYQCTNLDQPLVGLPHPDASASDLSRGERLMVRISAAVRLAGHADVRWHLWIVLAAAGRLDAALAAYACYFSLRALAVAARKAVRRG